MKRRPAYQWHCMTLDAEQVRANEVERLALLFGTLYMCAYMAEDMSLWLAPQADGTAELYFSPASEPFTQDVRIKYNAWPCARPRLERLHFLAGDQSDISTFSRGTVTPPPSAAHAPQNTLPVPFTYRTLREFNSKMIATQMLFVRGQVAPFLVRYVSAWFPVAGSPRGLGLRRTKRSR